MEIHWIIIIIILIAFITFVAIVLIIVTAIGKGLSGISSWYVSPGKNGEQRAARNIANLPSNEYFVINDLLINRWHEYTSQIDHVVVSRYGIFVIETKNITGHIYGSENAQKWKRYWKAWYRGWERSNELEFDNPILQNKAHIEALKVFLRNYNVNYISIVAFNPEAELYVHTNESIVIGWNGIANCIFSHRTPQISQEEARQIYEHLRAVNITDPAQRKQHANRAQVNKNIYDKKKIQAVSQGRCPKCGGNLILRNGKYGAFYGCSNYPNCKYTHPAG